MGMLNVIFGVTNLFVGGLLLVAALPLVKGVVKMNHSGWCVSWCLSPRVGCCSGSLS